MEIAKVILCVADVKKHFYVAFLCYILYLLVQCNNYLFLIQCPIVHVYILTTHCTRAPLKIRDHVMQIHKYAMFSIVSRQFV